MKTTRLEMLRMFNGFVFNGFVFTNEIDAPCLQMCVCNEINYISLVKMNETNGAS